MPTEQDAGAQRRRKVLNTYGRSTRKRVPKATFTPVTASESVSEEDTVTTFGTVAPRRQSPLAPSAKSRSRVASPPVRIKGNNEARSLPASSSDRKRKVSQIYTSRKPAQPATSESDEEDHPAAPEPRRSRITHPERPSASAVKSTSKERTSNQRVSPDSMHIETEPRLSSPPPTPTPPKVSRRPSKISRISRGGATNAAPTKNAPRKTTQQQKKIPLHLARCPSQEPKQSIAQPTRDPKKQTQLAPMKKPADTGITNKPRKRLIDALVEQDSGDSTVLDDNEWDTQPDGGQVVFSQDTGASELNSQVLPATPKPKVRTAPSTSARTFARSSSALKFTYGQGRKVREEDDNLLEALALPEESAYTRRRLDPEGPKKAFSSGTLGYDDDDIINNNSPSSKLRDIHELRQAGANSRVADAMQDLIDQIGRPGSSTLSSRRAALLQVAEKMREKAFIRQCRDHGVESALLKDIGNEADPICSYLILSSLVTILTKDPSAHIGQLLQQDEPGPIFALLLGISDDIKKVVKDRKSNLSKRSQSSIIAVESLLRDLPVWDGHEPSFISPRGLAIKCLEVIIGQDILVDIDTAIFTETVTGHLFDVLSDANRDAAYWDYPTTPQSIELRGALSVLDFHAVSMAATRGGNGEWAAQYLPIIADSFCTSLQLPPDNRKGIESLILKLTINITNNNLTAPGIFASKGLLPALAASICSSFDRALALISQDSWAEGVLDGLVLRLGILINFAEHSSQVRQIVNDCQYENHEPVGELIRLFIENHRRTGEADSMEKTHLNVALGYLSVLLGYLALYGPVRQNFTSKHSARSIGPLIGSIREFIAHYEQVENALSGEDNETRSHGSYVKQLQELVQQLEDNAAHD